MAKITLNDLAGLANETAAVTSINASWDAIEAFSDSVLSRDGTAPNFMEASLDMNGFSILNCPTIDASVALARAARLSMANDLAAPIGTTTITFDTADIDTATLFSALNNGILYTIAGIWQLDLCCTILADVTAADIQIITNVNAVPVRTIFATIPASKRTTLTSSGIISAGVDDVVTVQIVTTQDVTVDNDSTWLGTHYVGVSS